MSRPLHHLIGLFAALLSACAQAPEAIAPAQVNEAQYHGWTCRQLHREQARLNYTLATFYSEQSQSRTDDVIGYLTMLMPLASMSDGDLRHQIALLKGERAAVERLLGQECQPIRS